MTKIALLFFNGDKKWADKSGGISNFSNEVIGEKMVNCEEMSYTNIGADSWQTLMLEIWASTTHKSRYHLSHLEYSFDNIIKENTIIYKESIFEERHVVYIETTFCSDFMC